MRSDSTFEVIVGQRKDYVQVKHILIVDLPFSVLALPKNVIFLAVSLGSVIEFHGHRMSTGISMLGAKQIL